MTGSSANRLFKTELHFRSIIYGYVYKLDLTFNFLFFGKVKGVCKRSNVVCLIGKFTNPGTPAPRALSTCFTVKEPTLLHTFFNSLLFLCNFKFQLLR